MYDLCVFPLIFFFYSHIIDNNIWRSYMCANNYL